MQRERASWRTLRDLCSVMGTRSWEPGTGSWELEVGSSVNSEPPAANARRQPRAPSFELRAPRESVQPRSRNYRNARSGADRGSRGRVKSAARSTGYVMSRLGTVREGAGGVLPRTPPSSSSPLQLLPVLSAAAPPVLLESLAGRQIFPATNWWNQDVSAAPLDSSSAAYISWIGTAKSLHPDFGPPPTASLTWLLPAIRRAFRSPFSTPRRATQAFRGWRACPICSIRNERKRRRT